MRMRKLEIGSHVVDVIETNDLNVFGSSERLGRYSIHQLKIWIKKGIAESMKYAVLFHEIYEFCLAYYGLSYDHDGFQKFSLFLYDVLTKNKLLRM